MYVFVSLLLAACGDLNSRLDGTWTSHLTGVAEQEISMTFKPDGTARMFVGSTQVPLEVAYKVEGNKITTGVDGDYIITILDNGDLLANGLRLTKVSVAQSSPVNAVSTNSQSQAVDGWSQALREKTLNDCSARAQQNNDTEGIKQCECVVERAAFAIPEDKADELKEDGDVREIFKMIVSDCQKM